LGVQIEAPVSKRQKQFAKYCGCRAKWIDQVPSGGSSWRRWQSIILLESKQDPISMARDYLALQPTSKNVEGKGRRTIPYYRRSQNASSIRNQMIVNSGLGVAQFDNL
jgi:hypothetical protein